MRALDNLSEKTANGKRARAEKGLWNSGFPSGYQVDYRKDGGEGLAYPDEDATEGVRLAFK
jgi:DNA invertase Pin-like site-specific DNA recombinase